MVTPGYYSTFGIRITRGRAFTEADAAGSVPVAMVNAELVKRYFPNVDPLTQRLSVEQLIPGVTNLGPPIDWQIVGVYENVRNGGPKQDGFPEIDVPFAQSPWPSVTMSVRTTGIPEQMNKKHCGGSYIPSIRICRWPMLRPWTRFWTNRWVATASALSCS